MITCKGTNGYIQKRNILLNAKKMAHSIYGPV